MTTNFNKCVSVLSACVALQSLGIKGDEVSKLETSDRGVLFIGADGVRSWFYNFETGAIE